MEEQVNNNNGPEEQRTWFQSKKERQQEKGKMEAKLLVHSMHMYCSHFHSPCVLFDGRNNSATSQYAFSLYHCSHLRTQCIVCAYRSFHLLPLIFSCISLFLKFRWFPLTFYVLVLPVVNATFIIQLCFKA